MLEKLTGCGMLKTGISNIKVVTCIERIKRSKIGSLINEPILKNEKKQ